MLIEKLREIQVRFIEVSKLISDPEVINDMKRYVKLNREYKELEKIDELHKNYQNILSNIQSSKDILSNEKDEELREMAKSELDELSHAKSEMEEEIKLLLVPADP
ncbi:PCRF domain-containing protein, partial [Bacteroidota bacterium]